MQNFSKHVFIENSFLINFCGKNTNFENNLMIYKRSFVKLGTLQP